MNAQTEMSFGGELLSEVPLGSLILCLCHTPEPRDESLARLALAARYFSNADICWASLSQQPQAALDLLQDQAPGFYKQKAANEAFASVPSHKVKDPGSVIRLSMDDRAPKTDTEKEQYQRALRAYREAENDVSSRRHDQADH